MQLRPSTVSKYAYTMQYIGNVIHYRGVKVYTVGPANGSPITTNVVLVFVLVGVFVVRPIRFSKY